MKMIPMMSACTASAMDGAKIRRKSIIAKEKKLVQDLAQNRCFPGETELEANLRESEGESEFLRCVPKLPWPLASATAACW
jgi:hypothetical protein